MIGGRVGVAAAVWIGSWEAEVILSEGGDLALGGSGQHGGAGWIEREERREVVATAGSNHGAQPWGPGRHPRLRERRGRSGGERRSEEQAD